MQSFASTNLDNIYIYTVSQNKLHKLFVSELRQVSINFNNFWYVDNRIAKVLYHKIMSFPTSLISPHSLVKHKSTKFVNNASRRSKLGSTEIHLSTRVSKWNGLSR